MIQPNRVLELHDGGATVVLQGLQLTDPHLAKLSNNLALALDHPVQVNAYLSPPAAHGLELHYDLHDVFVVQLEVRSAGACGIRWSARATRCGERPSRRRCPSTSWQSLGWT